METNLSSVHSCLRLCWTLFGTVKAERKRGTTKSMRMVDRLLLDHHYSSQLRMSTNTLLSLLIRIIYSNYTKIRHVHLVECVTKDRRICSRTSFVVFVSFQVEATDDDCSNPDHRVCDYRILTADVPFAIDANGSISIIGTLKKDLYQFDVVAVDCDRSSTMEKISEPAQVTVKLIKSCKPTITGSSEGHRLAIVPFPLASSL